MAAVSAGGRADRERMRWILKADRSELWRRDGHKSCVQFVSAVFHISNWKARRWVEAAHGLEHLPHLAAALEGAALSLDKVVELARFVTAADESRWVKWAAQATTGQVRTRAENEVKRTTDEAQDVEVKRSFSHWRWDHHICFEGQLPLAEGERVMRVIDALADELPAHPDDEAASELLGTGENTIDQRRADAFVALVTHSGEVRSDTTVVVHAPLDALISDEGAATIEGDGPVHPETLRRLCCDSHIRTVVDDGRGGRLGIGRTSRVVPRWLRDEVLERDGYMCTFPGCEHKRFVDIHHIVHWSRGGPTDLGNLITLCSSHHKLVHEHGWSVSFDTRHMPTWFRPGGRVYEPGPAPPNVVELKKDPPKVAEAIGYSRLLGLAAVI